jgi:hypothetical protein
VTPFAVIVSSRGIAVRCQQAYLIAFAMALALNHGGLLEERLTAHQS